MRARAIGAWFAVIALGACAAFGGQSGDEGAKGTPPRGGPEPPTRGDVPLPICGSDDTCRRYAEDQADRVRDAIPDSARELVDSRCIEGCATAPACACLVRLTQREGNDALDAFVLGSGFACDVPARGHTCLLLGADFAGCDPQQPESCAEACTAATTAIERDLGAHDVEVRSAHCDEDRCLSVVRIDDACHGDDSSRHSDAPAQPCELSDDAILAAAFPDDPAAATDGGISGMRASGPAEANWTMTAGDAGTTWLGASICGAEFEPRCVAGPCPADAGGGP